MLEVICFFMCSSEYLLPTSIKSLDLLSWCRCTRLAGPGFSPPYGSPWPEHGNMPCTGASTAWSPSCPHFICAAWESKALYPPDDLSFQTLHRGSRCLLDKNLGLCRVDSSGGCPLLHCPLAGHQSHCGLQCYYFLSPSWKAISTAMIAILSS